MRRAEIGGSAFLLVVTDDSSVPIELDLKT